MITDDQLYKIQGFLLSEGIAKLSLREDLTDHFCCVIEECMDEEKLGFDEAFSEAQKRIAPDGVKRIEEDLHYLLTIKKKIMLRKIVFLLGFLGVLNLMLALALNISGILDAQTSGLIALSGILTLSISILPFYFYQLYLRSVQNVKEA